MRKAMRMRKTGTQFQNCSKFRIGAGVRDGPASGRFWGLGVMRD